MIDATSVLVTRSLRVPKKMITIPFEESLDELLPLELTLLVCVDDTQHGLKVLDFHPWLGVAGNSGENGVKSVEDLASGHIASALVVLLGQRVAEVLT